MGRNESKFKQLIDVEVNDCRWPIGDPRQPGFHFCGAQKIDGRPYCAEHWAMSFVPTRPREAPRAPMQPPRAAA